MAAMLISLSRRRRTSRLSRRTNRNQQTSPGQRRLRQGRPRSPSRKILGRRRLRKSMRRGLNRCQLLLRQRSASRLRRGQRQCRCCRRVSRWQARPGRARPWQHRNVCLRLGPVKRPVNWNSAWTDSSAREQLLPARSLLRRARCPPWLQRHPRRQQFSHRRQSFSPGLLTMDTFHIASKALSRGSDSALLLTMLMSSLIQSCWLPAAPWRRRRQLRLPQQLRLPLALGKLHRRSSLSRCQQLPWPSWSPRRQCRMPRQS
mmetsp:Transcript_52445/g.113600  ORF Transcript_52445/g.113600 Transcript_52445/m.113600 type:complete len:260 (+) Transcript_52445:3632-4411(+)